MAARAAGETAIAPVASRYRRREPERTLLHATVRAHWKTFLAEVEEGCGGGGSLPRFVVGEFERYLACGILANGFARVRCAACGDELLVALSCKGRGFCPSCTTRRMGVIGPIMRLPSTRRTSRPLPPAGEACASS
jgi:hypothetical protein